MNYLEQQGDHFPKSWKTNDFENQLDILMDEQAFLAVTGEGFVRLSLIEKIFQFVKILLGGTHDSQKQRIQATWLKFLYYGEAKECLNDHQIQRLHSRIYSRSAQHLDPAIKEMFQEIEDYHKNSFESKSDHLSKLRGIVTDYHYNYQSRLKPGFWTCLFTKPSFDIEKLIFFGDTPLELSKRALQVKNPNPHTAFNYLQMAFELKNDDPQFQEKLAEQLQVFTTSYSSELGGQKRKIQSLWIELGQTAFQNELNDLAQDYLSEALQTDSSYIKARLEIGKLYLINQEYELAEAFLPDLQKNFQNQVEMQIKIAQAYCELQKLDEGIKVYETLIKNYEKQPEKFSDSPKHIASAYHQIGKAHLNKTISSSTPKEAISFLSTAVKLDPKVSDYQEDLYQAYSEEWQVAQKNFAASYGQEWLKFLSKLPKNILQKYQEQIIERIVDCSEQFFKGHDNQKAHTYLEKLLMLFPSDVEVKIEVLDLAITYGDPTPFKSKFDAWEEEHDSTNPYLKAKIADAYWDTDKTMAVKAYEVSLDLFDKHLSHFQDDQERIDYQEQIAHIQARIGQAHLQTKPGAFKGIPYENAIKNLEKAAALKPDVYSSQLFDAYLAAAKAEKQRLILVRDKEKILTNYQKAFEISKQQGDYLIELMELYLDNKRDEAAASLYYEIKEQPWHDKFILSAKAFNQLGKIFSIQQDNETSLDCHQHAYQLDPKNQKYKQEYFQLSLQLAQSDYENIQNREEIDTNVEDLLKVAENLNKCWKIGFDHLKQDLKSSFQETLINIYRSLAHSYLQLCMLPTPEKTMAKQDVKQHKKNYEKEIQLALQYYNKALSYKTENASLHFDKGMLLDWIVDYDEAIKEFELAVKYEPCNPFYHKLLGGLYFVIQSNTTKNAEHDALVDQYASPAFWEDYRTWSEEFMSQVKTKEIDPHSYTQKKSGWFS